VPEDERRPDPPAARILSGAGGEAAICADALDSGCFTVLDEHTRARARVRRSAPAATASSTHSAALHLAPQRQPSMHFAPQSNFTARAGFMNFNCGCQS
jgi:hypothetical protein